MNNSRFSSQYLSQLELLKLESRRKFLGAKHGGHISLKKGHGIEFSDYRQYQLGDNPRYIDWKVYGRSDKLYLKRSQEEQDFSVSIMIDGSASMLIDQEKWNYASDLALSLAYLALIQQDSLSIEILTDDLKLSANSLKSFWNIAKKLGEYRVTDSSENSIGASLRKAASRNKFPGLAILISDLHFSLQEIQEGIRYLQAKNLEIIVLQVLGKGDLNPVGLQQDAELQDAENNQNMNLTFDSENQQLLKKLIEDHSQKCREYFAKNQIAFAVFDDSKDLISSLRESKQALKVIR